MEYTQKDKDRFWGKVAFSQAGCWEWKARCEKSGYAQFWLNGTTIMGHRMAYESAVGPIPEGLTIDHLCRNTSCVRPEHLEAVTLRENLLRGTGFVAINASKLMCKNGHAFTVREDNGKRHCLTCRSEISARWRHKKYTERGYGPGEKPRKDHCPQGHPYSGENLYIAPNGGKFCKKCAKIKNMAYRKANPDARRIEYQNRKARKDGTR